MLALLSFYVKVIAFAACIQQTANANNQHTVTMPTATRTIPSITESDKARFWAKVDKNGPLPDPLKYPELTTPCWVWTAFRGHKGHGMIGLGISVFLAHRISWSLANGPIPDGLCALHQCDNSSCVNPEHLFLGTKKDNVLDMDAKGRRGSASGDANGARLHPEKMARGERVSLAKLTKEIVVEMRHLHASGASCAELGRKFGVNKTCAWSVIRGKTWAHV